MPDLMTIHETCGCGAKFSSTTKYPSDSIKAASAWRHEHRHPEPGPRNESAPTHQEEANA